MMTRTLLASALLVWSMAVGGCAATTGSGGEGGGGGGGLLAPGEAGRSSAASRSPGKAVKRFEQDGKVAYMGRQTFTLHDRNLWAKDGNWVLGGSYYQNDLTGRGRMDPDAHVMLMMAFKGSPDIFSPAKDSMKMIFMLDGQPVFVPVAWQQGPDRVFGVTQSVFSAVLDPEVVRQILAADDVHAGLADTSKPDLVEGKVWTYLTGFDMDKQNAVEPLRAFVASGGAADAP